MRRHVFALLAVATLFGGIAAGDERTNLPERINLSEEFRKFGMEPLRQGERNVCSLFAISSLAEFEIARRSPEARTLLSEEFLTWAANEATGRRGDQAMFYEAVHGLNVFGICSKSLMPFEEREDAGRKPGQAALDDAKGRSGCWKVQWIRRWNVQQPLPEAELVAIKHALASGHPVACGLRWPRKGSHRLLEVPSPEDVFDGHSIAFIGYEDDSQHPGGGVFHFRNSWGPEWGDGGNGVMSYAYVRAYANDALWLQLGSSRSEHPLERVEAEELSVHAESQCSAAPQDMKGFGGGMWSGRRQLFCRAEQDGFVELKFPVQKSGKYRVCVQATAAPDYGTVRASLDSRDLDGAFDLYCGRVSPYGAIELGTHSLNSGEHLVRISVIGKNAVSSGYSFGLDTVDLLPAE